jgi:hypothetical protein
LATEIEIKKQKEKIANLEEVLEGEETPKLKREKAKLKEMIEEGKSTEIGEDSIDLGMTQEEFNEVGTGFSKRPVEGEYVAIIGIPVKDYSEASHKIPVIIEEEGAWKGLEDALYPSKTAGFSLKNVYSAASIKPQENPKTKKLFYPALSVLEGRKVMAVYKLVPSKEPTWIGNDGMERPSQPQSKLVHLKPFYEKPKTII